MEFVGRWKRWDLDKRGGVKKEEEGGFGEV
jgi:hypothetical protein